MKDSAQNSREITKHKDRHLEKAGEYNSQNSETYNNNNNNNGVGINF